MAIFQCINEDTEWKNYTHSTLLELAVGMFVVAETGSLSSGVNIAFQFA
jgi:hypothetical protein